MSPNATWRKLTTDKKVLSAVVIIAVLLLSTVGLMFGGLNDNNSAFTAAYHQEIEYIDSTPDTTNSSVKIGYYGIAATEYNPEKWQNSGYVGNNSNWVGPAASPVTVTSGTIGTVRLIFEGNSNTTYTVNFPDTHTIKKDTYDKYCVTIVQGVDTTPANLTVEDHRIIYRQTANKAILDVQFADCTIIPSKVFGGWEDVNGNIILPGDVVDKNINMLMAHWVTPDVFVLQQSYISWNQLKSNVTTPKTSTTLEVVSPHCYLGFSYKSGETKDGKIGIIDYNTDGSIKNNNYSNKYSSVIRGDGRQSPDMFGTIYLLTAERAKETSGKLYYYANLGQNTAYPNGFTTGTYRSADDGNYCKCILMINASGAQSAKLLGNAIFDNIKISGDNPSIHGDSVSSSLFANNHILIMGSNITNPETNTNDLKGIPQIFGGSNATDITTPINEPGTDTPIEKNIIFKNGRNNDVKVKLGTYVIIHSGLYGNIVAGSFGTCTMGSENNYLSTYLVLKGGSTVDTVAGGTSGDKSKGTIYGGDAGDETSGGTFIYVIDHFLPGDDWEDIKANCYGDKYQRNKYSIAQSTILEGGSSKGIDLNNQTVIHGSTHIFLTGTSSVWDVQAGGRSGYTHADYAYLEISGLATVRHVACGSITDGTKNTNNCVDGTDIVINDYATVASVYGAGYDTWQYPEGKSIVDGTIKVTISGGRVGNVYGGGYRGSIGNESDYTKLKIYVTIDGGEVLGDVYGGGSGGLDKIRHNPDGTFSNKTTSSYTTSTGRSYVYGEIHVTVSGSSHVYGNVYGGGMSVPKLSTYAAGDKSVNFTTEKIGNKANLVASVFGNIFLEIKDGATIDGSVYGGGKGVTATYRDSKWNFENMTTSLVVDMNKIYTDDPFFQLPWYTSSEGGYEYTYDSSDAFIAKEMKNNTPTGLITGGNYLEYAKVEGLIIMYLHNGSVSETGIVSTGTIGSDVYGGGAYGKVYGGSIVEMTGGIVEGNVFAGGLGTEGNVSVTGDRVVYITGATSHVTGSVYGGSSIGDDGPKSTFHIKTSDNDTKPEVYADATVVIDQAVIDGSIYGGGFMGKTWGSTHVQIGYEILSENGTNYSSPYKGTEKKTISVKSIYAGGNISTENESGQSTTTIIPFSTSLVQGHGEVLIYGNADHNDDVRITGSIMGSGNSCNTELSTYVEILNLHNNGTITGIHRASELLISQSVLEISGRSTLTTSKTASIFDIGDMTLKYDTTIEVGYPIDDVDVFHSVNMYNDPTTSTSPSNTIVFTGGSTFYIRDLSGGSFGMVTGYTTIATKSDESYGAYAIGRSDSTGGFVVMKEGTYREADRADFDNGSACWFIGGAEKKVITMNLQADSTRALTEVEASIELTKLSNNTKMQYIGGAFTSLGSDSEGQDYVMTVPGLVNNELPAINQFGLVFGYLGTNTGHTLIAGSEYTFNGFTGTSVLKDKLNCAYFDENSIQSILFNTGDDSPSGTYVLNMVFTGAPENKTAYIGYITLNFQEVSIISVEGEGEYSMPSNTIEVRIDLYVLASGSSAFNQDYTVKIKTDATVREQVTYQTGYTEVLIPKTSVMTPLKINQLLTNIPAGTKIQITAVMNQDNTTGWMTTAGTIELTGDARNLDITVGVLSGTSVATIRYAIVDHVLGSVTDNTYKVKFLLPITTDTYSTVSMKVEQKPNFSVTFKGIHGPGGEIIDITYEDRFPYGSKLNKSDCPETGAGFVGWYLDSDFTIPYNHDLPMTKNLVLFARYMYVVTFNNMDGTSSQLYLSQDGNGTRIKSSMLPEPSRTGYTLDGWYKDRDFIYRWDPTYDTVTKDITLYAKWSGIEVKVNFLYDDNGTWTKFKTENHTDYVMKETDSIVNGELVKVAIYPTVRIGSTFSVVDPEREMNILDVAQKGVEEALGENKKFIRWQIFINKGTANEESVYIYYDTELATYMVNLSTIGSSGMPEIDLYAVTSTIAIKITMDKNTDDASAIVAAPSSFHVFPDGPGDIREIDGKYYDNDGNEYLRKTDSSGTYYILKDNGQVRNYPDGKGNYYFRDEYVLKDFVETVETEYTDEHGDTHIVVTDVTRYLDNYGNVWTVENNGYVFVRCTVYTESGGVITKYSDITADQIPAGAFYMDKYDNRYTRSGTATPSIDDTYTCTKGSMYYYTFIYTLNEATRSGWRLTHWSNDLISDPLDPRPGAERMVKVFVKFETTGTYVEDAILEATDSDGNPAIRHFEDIEQYHIRIDDPEVEYGLIYKAQWAQLEYLVTIVDPTHGIIDGFIVRTNGTRVHITGRTQYVHYGDIIELSYTPDSYYQFNKWSVTGECMVDDEDSQYTSIMITGGCTITANEIGERIVSIEMVYDNNNISAEDLAKMSVYMKNKDTGSYTSMTLRSGASEYPKAYRSYVSLGDYVVCLRYGTENDYEEYELLGDLTVDRDGNTSFKYYVISASICTENITVKIDDVTKTDRSEYVEGSIISFTRYVGARDLEIFGRSQEDRTENPNGGLPAVEITIASGYDYTMYEGIEVDGVVQVNQLHNYYDGTTDNGQSVTKKFYLNWTRYDRPALIVVHTQTVSKEITYQAMNDNGEVIKSLTISVDYGSSLNINAVTAQILPYLEGRNIIGWYFDSAFTNQVFVYHNLDDSTINLLISSDYKLYAKTTASGIQNINTVIVHQNVNGGYDQVTPVALPFPLIRVGETDTYTAVYTVRPTSGMKVVANPTCEAVPGINATAVLSSDGNTVTFTATMTGGWDGHTLPVFSIIYMRNTATLSVTDTEDIISGGWDGNSKSVLFGQEIVMPTMKEKDGHAISGWTASIGDVDIRFENGKYIYTVGPNDTGNIAFTAVYPAKMVDITFITPIGKFVDNDNKTQRLVVEAEYGSSVNAPTVENPDPQTYTSYRFTYNDETVNFPVTATEDITYIVQWTVEKYEFDFTSDSHIDVSTVITKGPSGHYELEPGNDIIITINPRSGYDLDLEATLAASTPTTANFGTPIKLSGDRGYTWTITVNSDMTLNVKSKVASANINFIVNGVRIDATNPDTPIPTISGDTDYRGINIPLYTTVTFNNYLNGNALWYTKPEMSPDDVLPHIIVDGKYVYTVTVRENMSLYTSNYEYRVYYHDKDGNITNIDTFNTNSSFTLSDYRPTKSGSIFVGWAIMEGDSKVFKYIPQDTIAVDQHTANRFDLYAYFVDDGNVVLEYNGSGQSSSVGNGNNTGQTPISNDRIEVHYNLTDVMTAENYRDKVNDQYIYTIYPSSFQQTNVGELTVYYFGHVIDDNDHKYLFHGSYTITVIGNKVIRFYDGETLIEERRIADYQTVGSLPVRDKNSYQFNGWYFRNTENEITAETTGSSLAAETNIDGRWLKIHTVTFDTVGGSTIEPQYVVDGNKATKPTNPTRATSNHMNYTFVDWKLATQQGMYDFNTSVTGDITLIAIWESTQVPKHNVEIYSAIGGVAQLASTSQIYDGDSIAAPDDPQGSPGLTYHGWYQIISMTSPSSYVLSDEPFDFTSIIHSDIKLIPKWTVNHYTIVLDNNGGSGSQDPIDDVSVVSGQTPRPTINNSAFSREGYRLDGWSTTPSGSIVVVDVITTPLSMVDGSTVILYAQWTRIHDVTFYENGGTTVPDEHDVVDGSSITLPTTTREGYTFNGWLYNTQTYNAGESFVVSADNITFTAQWTIKTYTVTFNTTGGSAVAQQTIEHGSLAVKPADPTREASGSYSYTFSRWIVVPDGNEFLFTTPITQNITLSAVWEATAAHPVGVYSNINGTLDFIDYVYVYNGRHLSLEDPTSDTEGLTFMGWHRIVSMTSPTVFVLDENPFDFSAPITTDGINLAPKWRSNFYDITFDYNGGEGSMAPIHDSAMRQAPIELNNSSVHRDGFRFLGWTRTIDGPVAYTNTIDAPLTKTDGAAITLYAKWINIYNVTFDTNGGTAVENWVDVNAGTVRTLPTTTRTGYTFNGWKLNDTTYDAGASYTVNSTVTFTAQWTINTYTVTFDTNGGTVIDPQQVQYLGKAVRPADPTKQATPQQLYTFVRWVKLGSQNEYNFDTQVTENILLIAIWNVANAHYVQTYSNVQNTLSLVSTIPVYDGQKLTPLSTPEGNPALTFQGWYRVISMTSPTDYTFADTAFDFNTAITEDDIKLAPKWKENEYTIAFNYNGGTGNLSPITHVKAVSKAPIAVDNSSLQYDGHRFLGWALTSDGEVKFTNTIITPLTTVDGATVTLYAKWINIYNITFDENGGSAVSDLTGVDVGTVITLPTTTKTGYTFTKWKSGETYYDAGASYTVNGNATFTAQWQINTYTVTFDTNGGSTVDAQNVQYGHKATRPADPTKQATSEKLYTFDKWVLFGSQDAFNFESTEITGDTTLIAIWTAVGTYTVETYSNSQSTLSLISSIPVYDGYKMTALSNPTPTKAGLTCLGWFKIISMTSPTEFVLDTTPFDFNTAITENIKLAPKWKVNLYNITFNYNGGQGDMPAIQNVSALSEEPIALDNSSVTRNGYRFLGWALTSEGEVAFTDTLITPLTTVDGATVTLYAKWIETHNVIFDSKGGSTVTNKTGLDHGTVITLPTTTREGYTFTKWKSGETYYDAGASYTVNGNATFEAQWTINTYRVTFDTNGGTEIPYQDIQYGGKVTRPDDPTKQATPQQLYTFVRWIKLGSQDTYDFDTPVSGNMTLVAVWNIANAHHVDTYSNIKNELSFIASIAVYDGFTLTLNPPAGVEGMTFLGWYRITSMTSSTVFTLAQQPFDFTTPITTDDIKLAPKWRANLYTIQFDHNDNTGNSHSMTDVSAMQSVVPLDNSMMTRAGYRFDGWATTQNGEVKYVNTITEPLTKVDGATVTLYAKWTRLFDVAFNSNGGSDVEDMTDIPTGTVITLPSVTRTGYDFSGWRYGGNDYAIGDSFTVTTDGIGFVAQWTIKTYTIHFNSNGGTAVVDQTVQYGQIAQRPADPSRESDPGYSYRFNKWIVTPGGQEYYFDTPVTGNITLSASWIATPAHMVHTYSAVQGKAQFVSSIPVYDQEYVTLDTPTPGRAGLTFQGWYYLVSIGTDSYTIGDQFYPTTTPITTDISVIPEWSINTYTIHFDNNGGTGSMADMTNVSAFQEYIPLDNSSMLRTGYRFDGWATTQSGNVEFVNAIDRALSTTQGAEITLYAKWTLVHNVAFDVAGGEAMDPMIGVEHGTQIILPQATRTGYTFNGWKIGDVIYEAGANYVVNTDASFTALWTINSYTITFNSNGGSPVAQQVVQYGKKAVKPTNPTRTFDTYSYAFNRWVVVPGGQTYDFNDPVAGNVNLSAVWDVYEPHNVETYSAINDIANIVSVIPVYHGHKLSELAYPSAPMAGLTCLGWYQIIAMASPSLYTLADEPFDFDTPITEDIKLIPKWKVNEYDITFDYNGGTGTMTPIHDAALRTTELTLDNTVQRFGYKFDGWSLTEGGAVAFTTSIPAALSKIDGDTVTLYAVWTQLHTIDFYTNGGSEVTTPVENIVHGDTYPLPNTTREGYIFNGWEIVDSTKGNKTLYQAGYEFPVTEDIGFIANWSIITYKATFNTNYEEMIANQTIAYGEKFVYPNLTRTGYTLDGWFTDAEFQNAYDFTVAPTADAVLYAKWSAWTLDVTYLPGEHGTGEMDVQSVSYADSEELRVFLENGFNVDAGYTFAGWRVTDGETIYNVGDDITPLFTTVGGTLSLTAIYNANQTVITLNGNGANIPSVPATVTGTYASVLPDLTSIPVRYDYDFLGFNTEQNGSGLMIYSWNGKALTAEGYTDENKVWINTGNEEEGITLYAQWEYDPYIPPTPPEPDERTIHEEETIYNEDGSVTHIVKDTTIRKDGTTTVKEHDTTTFEDGEVIEKELESFTDKDGSVTENVHETTTYPDGKLIEKETESFTDKDGRRCEDSVETITDKDPDGNDIREVIYESTDLEGNSVKEDTRIVTDDEGNVIDAEIEKITEDAEGKGKIIIIRGDRYGLEALVPDEMTETLGEVDRLITDIVTEKVTVVFEREDGGLFIPKEYLAEASGYGYGIAVNNRTQYVAIDKDVVSHLSAIGEDAYFSIREVKYEELTEKQKPIIGHNYALSISIVMNGHSISELGGFADIMIITDSPYDHVYYVTDDAEISEIECDYDETTRTLKFTLVHFSVYALTEGPLIIDDGDKDEFPIGIVIAIIIAAIAVVAVTAFVIKRR